LKDEIRSFVVKKTFNALNTFKVHFFIALNPKQMKITSTLWILFLLSLLGCQQIKDLKDVEPLNYQSDLAFSLINTETTAREIINNVANLKDVFINADGSIRFQYRGDIIKRTSNEVFSTIGNSIPPIIPALSPSLELPFSLPTGVRLDRVDMKSGDFVYYFENPSNEPLKVTITIPQLLNNGKPFTIVKDVPAYSGSGQKPIGTNQSAPVSMSGYAFIPDKGVVNLNYTAVTSSGKTVKPELFIYKFSNLAFSYAEGFFGTLVYTGGKDSISIDFFKSYLQGNFRFADPRATFYFQNSFGVPAKTIVKDFRVINFDGSQIKLVSDYVANGIDLPYPLLSERGKVKYDTFFFDRNNSNITDLLGSSPVKVIFNIDAVTNPNGNIKGFVTDDGFYLAQVLVDLPLYGRVSNFAYKTDVALDLSKLKNVDRAQFKIITENALPLDATVQAYFLDTKGKIIDSLLMGAQRLLQGAPANSQGIATTSVTKTTFANIDSTRFDKIRVAKKIQISLSLSTELSNPGKSVRALADQLVKVKVGAIVGVKSN
jgi:hypothetical protein